MADSVVYINRWQKKGELFMPIPFKRNTGYLLAYGSLTAAGLLMLLYLRAAWSSPLPAALYGALGVLLALCVLCALVLAADSVRLLLQPGTWRVRWWKIILDLLPLALLVGFWML